MADDLVYHFSEADCFMDSCMKLTMRWRLSQHRTRRCMSTCRRMQIDNRKFFTKYSVSMLFNHPTNFKPKQCRS